VLEKRAYQEGGYVRKGDLLFEIDPRPFVAALAQAKGQLQEAQATLLGVELEARRAKELWQGKVTSEQDYTNKTQIYQTKLAAVDEAQLNLGYTTILSPLDGIAGQAQAQIGDLVGTGTNSVLTTVSQIEPIRCYFPVNQQSYWEFADRLKEMMSVPEAKHSEGVELILPDGSVYPPKGKFAFVDRQVDPKTGTIQIAVNVPNPELTFRPGQYAMARAEIQMIRNALLTPQQAISELQGGECQQRDDEAYGQLRCDHRREHRPGAGADEKGDTGTTVARQLADGKKTLVVRQTLTVKGEPPQPAIRRIWRRATPSG
jgi:RND family efflux transporter MFP subunit